MGDGGDDDGWETVSEHTVNSGEEEEEQEEEQEAGQGSKNMQEAAAAVPASEAGAGRSSGKSKSEPSAAVVSAAAAAAGGGQPQGIVPEAEDLTAFVAEQVSKNADAGLKTVAAAIKEAHPQWAVGEARLKKMLSEVKTGGKKKEGPVEVQPLSLDADGRIAGIEGMDFAFRSFHDAFDFSDPEAMAKLVADCRVGFDPLHYPRPPSLYPLLSPQPFTALASLPFFSHTTLTITLSILAISRWPAGVRASGWQQAPSLALHSRRWRGQSLTCTRRGYQARSTPRRLGPSGGCTSAGPRWRMARRLASTGTGMRHTQTSRSRMFTRMWRLSRT
jgi:hypothetical protein